MLLGPLLEFAIYATVFGVIFRGSYHVAGDETRATYALGVFLSLTLYRLLAETINASPSLIVAQANYVKKVVFPLHLLPLSAVAAASYRFLVSLALFLVAFALVGPGFHAVNLLLPLVLLPLLLHAIGLAWLLSALGVFLRDIGQLTGIATLVLLYSSAVFYSASGVAARSEFAWSILRFNPLLHLIESARAVMIWHAAPAPASLAYVWLSGAVVCALGYAVFRKLRPAFADVV
jgi:lipopolysaccharide transport system permease protein